MSTTVYQFIVMALSAGAIILAFWGFKGWETSRSLRQVILLGEEVCEICAKLETQLRHTHTTVETHGYVPVQMVYRPSPVQDTAPPPDWPLND